MLDRYYRINVDYEQIRDYQFAEVKNKRAFTKFQIKLALNRQAKKILKKLHNNIIMKRFLF